MASNILPLFWNLASSSKDARLTASVDLISTLEGFQQAHVQARAEESDSDNDDDDEEDEDADDDESGVEVDGSDDEGAVGLAYGNSIRKLDASLAKDNAEDVAYTVKRLVRGLASSRESSRFGFSVALTEVRPSFMIELELTGSFCNDRHPSPPLRSCLWSCATRIHPKP
jgi:DNA polymerase phi